MSDNKFRTLLEDIKQILTVEKIMTPKGDFVYYKDLEDNLDKSGFDILPKRNLKEYWDKRDGKIHKISPEDMISFHLDLLSFIDRLKDRDSYFIKHGREIEGIVHFSDLKKQHVRILFYILLSALELKMQRFYKGRDEFLKERLRKKRIDEINESINRDKERNQEMPLSNYLNFSDFLSILAKDEEFLNKKSYTKKKFEEDFNSINELRNWVAHPVRKGIQTHKSIKEFIIEKKENLFNLYELLEDY